MSGITTTIAHPLENKDQVINSLHEALHTQRILYQSVLHMDVAQVAVENEQLKTELFAALQDHHKMIEEMEKMKMAHEEEMKKAKRVIEDLREEKEDLNEEVFACHGHIRRLKSELKKGKNEVQEIEKDRELLKEKFEYANAVAEHLARQEQVEMMFEESDNEDDEDSEGDDGFNDEESLMEAEESEEEEIPNDPF